MSQVEAGLHAWLSQGHHGEMDYMAKHGTRRTRPAELVPDTLRVISVRMNNTPPAAKNSWEVLRGGAGAFISRYALGRDYHKVLRARLQKLADKIAVEVGPFNYRVFTDSAPVMEVEWAQRSGLGWRGKHTLLLTRESGSMFFWVKYIRTYLCLLIAPRRIIVAVVTNASLFVLLRPSLPPTGWTQGAVFLISLLSIRVAFRSSCAL